MESKKITLLILLGVIMSCTSPGEQSKSSATNGYEIDRSVLPIQPLPRDPVTIMDARDAEKPETFEVTAPEGAPNVVVVLIDDIGLNHKC